MLRLLGNDVRLELVGTNDARLTRHAGQMAFHSQVLLIDREAATSQVESTTLHEIIEWINHAFQVGLNEQGVCAMETGLYAALSDNGVSLAPLLDRADVR